MIPGPAARPSGNPASTSGSRGDAVVEVSVLLPAHRLDALLALARQTEQSVGQLLRGLIDRALSGPTS